MTTERHINLDPLERANARLVSFLARYAETDPEHPFYDMLQTAVVKGCEFTYELAFSAIRRYVAEYVLSPSRVGIMPNPDIIRVAARHGLTGPPDEWLEFRERRNAAAPEYYDADAAGHIVAAAPALHNAVSRLIARLHQRIQ